MRKVKYAPFVAFASMFLLGMSILILWQVASASTSRVPVAVPAQQTTCSSISSADVPKSIPDNSAIGVLSKIISQLPGFVASIQVNITFSHTYPQDLGFALCYPGGTRCLLALNQLTSTGGTYTISFSDSSTTAIPDGPPYGEVYRSINPLASAIGKRATGIWSLMAWDSWTGDVGTIDAWSLDLCTTSTMPTPTVTPTLVSSGGEWISQDTPLMIPADWDQSVDSHITVSGLGTYVQHLTIGLNVTISDTGGLIIDLIPPDCSSVYRILDSGDLWDANLVNTRFSDQNTNNIWVAGSSPWTGTFQPLYTFPIGEHANGTWTLRVTDDWGRGGTLDSWGLTIVGGNQTPTQTPVPEAYPAIFSTSGLMCPTYNDPSYPDQVPPSGSYSWPEWTYPGVSIKGCAPDHHYDYIFTIEGEAQGQPVAPGPSVQIVAGLLGYPSVTATPVFATETDTFLGECTPEFCALWPWMCTRGYNNRQTLLPQAYQTESNLLMDRGVYIRYYPNSGEYPACLEIGQPHIQTFDYSMSYTTVLRPGSWPTPTPWPTPASCQPAPGAPGSCPPKQNGGWWMW